MSRYVFDCECGYQSVFVHAPDDFFCAGCHAIVSPVAEKILTDKGVADDAE